MKFQVAELCMWSANGRRGSGISVCEIPALQWGVEKELTLTMYVKFGKSRNVLDEIFPSEKRRLIAC